MALPPRSQSTALHSRQSDPAHNQAPCLLPLRSQPTSPRPMPPHAATLHLMQPPPTPPPPRRRCMLRRQLVQCVHKRLWRLDARGRQQHLPPQCARQLMHHAHLGPAWGGGACRQWQVWAHMAARAFRACVGEGSRQRQVWAQRDGAVHLTACTCLTCVGRRDACVGPTVYMGPGAALHKSSPHFHALRRQRKGRLSAGGCGGSAAARAMPPHAAATLARGRKGLGTRAAALT